MLKIAGAFSHCLGAYHLHVILPVTDYERLYPMLREWAVRESCSSCCQGLCSANVIRGVLLDV